MDMSEFSNDVLLTQVGEFSKKITMLRDKPFCTIRQFEDLQAELQFTRIMFKAICDELTKRNLTDNDMMKFQQSLAEQTE